MKIQNNNSSNSGEQSSPSFFRRLGTGIANFVIIIIVGYIGLFLIFGTLSLIFPELNKMSSSSRSIIDSLYQGYVVGWGLGAILSFFTAFSGFSIIDKIKNWKKRIFRDQE
jgi:hypothetical protein